MGSGWSQNPSFARMNNGTCARLKKLLVLGRDITEGGKRSALLIRLRIYSHLNVSESTLCCWSLFREFRAAGETPSERCIKLWGQKFRFYEFVISHVIIRQGRLMWLSMGNVQRFFLCFLGLVSSRTLFLNCPWIHVLKLPL